QGCRPGEASPFAGGLRPGSAQRTYHPLSPMQGSDSNGLSDRSAGRARGSSRASVKARVSPMRSSNWRMGSSPALLESWPCDGSMTSDVPKKSRICGQAEGILISAFVGGEKTWQFDRLDVHGGQRFRNPFKKSGVEVPREPSRLLVPPMSEVTQILNAIEQGDTHAAEELLPLVYDELRKLAAQRLAQEKPGQTLQATALVDEAYLRLVGGQREQS